MKTPARLKPLIDDGIIDEVIRPLMNGKEAAVYIVRRGDQQLCAKVYKDAKKRSFKQAAQYQEGRKVRNSRRARAMEKSSKYGRKQEEELWHQAEVNALYLLSRAGVRVPEPLGCFDGVLVMTLVTDEDGAVAPRLNDVMMSTEQAIEDHTQLMHDIKRILCAGLVHGDLSEFNVLVDEHGPVIIDLPQAVNAAGNNNAQSMLSRDVQNITRYYAQFAPELSNTAYADEIWDLYENGELRPDTPLKGQFEQELEEADVDGVMLEIKAALAEEQARLERLRAADKDE